MKPYWRAESRRFEAFEATHGWIESRVGEAWLERSAPVVEAPRLRVLAAAPPPAPAFDAGRFARAFEGALAASDAALAALARCGAWSISRGFRCGGERPAAPWCGSPLCAPCAEARGREAARAAREAWPATILVADVPLGPPGRQKLPTAEEVVRARDGFARAARRLDVEGLARAVVTPDGVRLFAPAPASEALTAGALERLLRQGGLAEATVAAVGRDEAAARLEDALTLEARRFRDAVTFDQRQGDDARFAARWVAQARARQREARRAVVAGGKGALPVPSGVGTAPAACPAHGAGCAEAAAIVRDAAGQVAHRAAPLGARPTRQAFVRLCEAAAAGRGEARRAG
ncbi:MAG: hypothetical protein M9894_19790 [Planctomycetes bacterium]|nr:hypothetical protein [Planctomycetota bacterium]